MIDALPDPPDLDPASLSTGHFTRVRRGFEPTEVNTLLGRTADALRAWEERDERLVSRLDELERQLEASRELDEERITTVLGEETARIIAVAREAALDMRSKAEAEATRLVDEAERTSTAKAEALVAESTELQAEALRERDEAREEASLLRQQAIDETVASRAEAQAAVEAMRSAAAEDAARVRDDAAADAERLTAEAGRRHDEMISAASTVLGERTAEAEAAAASTRERAAADVAAARDDAERIIAEATEAGAAEVERAKTIGREMVNEAREVRERMLRDLAEKRKIARQQIEAARAGRARIIEALRGANESVSELVGDLVDGDRVVTRVADDAASSVADDIDLVVAELEATLMSEHAVAPLRDAGDQAEPSDGTEAQPAAEADSSEPAAEADKMEPPSEGTEAEPAAGADEAEPAAEADKAEPAAEDTDAEPAAEADMADPPAEASELATPEPTVPVAEPDDDGPDATVHDLFARIRADVDSPDQEPTDGGPDDAEVSPGDEGSVGGSDVVDVSTNDAVVAAAIEETDVSAVALNRRDELLAAPEKALGRLLKRAVSDEQNEVLDALRRTPRRSRPELDALLPADEVARFIAALRPDFSTAVAAGAEFWNESTSGSTGAVAESLLGLNEDPGVTEALTTRVGDLLALRRAHLQRTLDEADAEGLDITEIGDRVRAAYREWRTGAVPELAGDLAIAGFAEGARMAAGPSAQWCWVPDNGGLACSDAEDNSLAGAVACGEKFPTGDVVPPAHSGCRCILVPSRH